MNRDRVLVTGSSRGIGRAIALALGDAGFDVSLHYRANEDAARAVQHEMEEANAPVAEVLCFDVSDRDTTARILSQSVEARGPFYGVVLNAGVASDGPFPGIAGKEWDDIVTTNLTGFYNVLHPLIMPMIQLRKGGRIVAVSSVSGLVGNRGQVSYSASKAGLIGATKALSRELAKRKITVNCVAPGLITTDMTKHLMADELLAGIPMRRAGRPEEVASLVRFLFTGNAEYITGQVIAIDGGLT